MRAKLSKQEAGRLLDEYCLLLKQRPNDLFADLASKKTVLTEVFGPLEVEVDAHYEGAELIRVMACTSYSFWTDLSPVCRNYFISLPKE